MAAEIRFDRPPGRSAVPKSPKLYKTVGTNIPQTHLLERLGGGAFIHDLSFDGMLHGRVLRKRLRRLTAGKRCGDRLPDGFGAAYPHPRPSPLLVPLPFG